MDDKRKQIITDRHGFPIKEKAELKAELKAQQEQRKAELKAQQELATKLGLEKKPSAALTAFRTLSYISFGFVSLMILLILIAAFASSSPNAPDPKSPADLLASLERHEAKIKQLSPEDRKQFNYIRKVVTDPEIPLAVRAFALKGSIEAIAKIEGERVAELKKIEGKRVAELKAALNRLEAETKKLEAETKKLDTEYREQLKHIRNRVTDQNLPLPERENALELWRLNLKELSNAATRKKRIEGGFHFWDGSHIELTKIIKRRMNDPDSYKHVETRYIDRGDHIWVRTEFLGKKRLWWNRQKPSNRQLHPRRGGC